MENLDMFYSAEFTLSSRIKHIKDIALKHQKDKASHKYVLLHPINSEELYDNAFAVLSHNNKTIGYVQLEEHYKLDEMGYAKDREYEIVIYLVPKVRGRGYGIDIIKLAVKALQLRDKTKLYGIVVHDNERSHRMLKNWKMIKSNRYTSKYYIKVKKLKEV